MCTWILLALVMVVVSKRCAKGTKKWVKKEIVTATGFSPTVKVHALPQQQHTLITAGYV